MSEGNVTRPFKLVPKWQPQKLLSQAAPVQNTWYTVQDIIRNVRIYQISFAVAVANETLEIELTLDGVTYTATQAAVFGSEYQVYLYSNSTAVVPACSTGGIMLFGLAAGSTALSEFRSFKARIRKTTNTGAGTITAGITLSKW